MSPLIDCLLGTALSVSQAAYKTETLAQEKLGHVNYGSCV